MAIKTGLGTLLTMQKTSVQMHIKQKPGNPWTWMQSHRFESDFQEAESLKFRFLNQLLLWYKNCIEHSPNPNNI